jgi:hypothetical protein
MTTRIQLWILPLVAALNLFSQSCTHYQAGDGSSVPFSSIQVNPIKNQSQAPQITQILNHDLRQAFLQSGKVVVESSGADTQLNVTLTRYERENIATNSQDTGLARKYALTLVATCDLTNTGEDSAYFRERTVTATLDIFLDSGQTRAETNAIPLLSKKLADTIANEVLQTW